MRLDCEIHVTRTIAECLAIFTNLESSIRNENSYAVMQMSVAQQEELDLRDRRIEELESMLQLQNQTVRLRVMSTTPKYNGYLARRQGVGTRDPTRQKTADPTSHAIAATRWDIWHKTAQLTEKRV